MRARSLWLPSAVIAAVVAGGCTTTAISPPPLRAPALVVAAAPTTSSSTAPTTTSTSTEVPPPTSTTTAPRPTPPVTSFPAPPRGLTSPCRLEAGTPPPLRGNPVAASVQLAHSLVCRATDVVVAPPGGGPASLQAAQTIGAPLVYATPDAPYDPGHLGAARVWTPEPSLVLGGSHSVLPLPRVGEADPRLETLARGEVEEEVERASVDNARRASTLVVVSPRRPELGPVAAAAAGVVDATAVWTTPGDMRRRSRLGRLAEFSDTRLLVGDFSPAASWQMDVLAAGRSLPGGGQVLFPGKRLVALYGHPHTPALGVLGEQPVEEAVVRAKKVADLYATQGTATVPAFEIITTTATASAGEDGDYSSELTVDDLRPWVEAAGAAGYYTILDLQPGRTDFLTQARRYEELLRLPYVGLALDPEWRLGSKDRHLRQIGSVAGGEINQVVHWLAGLVREERLPQKLLVLHQFKLQMITERETIEAPPELAIVIQMDGQGPLGTKYDTWNTLVAADDRRWWWGWKNFLDEDSPTPSPRQVLDLEPQPVFVSYQ